MTVSRLGELASDWGRMKFCVSFSWALSDAQRRAVGAAFTGGLIPPGAELSFDTWEAWLAWEMERRGA